MQTLPAIHDRTGASQHAAARRGRKGTEILEAALALPILFMLVFGIIQFGWYFYLVHNVQGAAREGVRRAAIANSTETDIKNAVARVMNAVGLQENTEYAVEIYTVDPDDTEGTHVSLSNADTHWPVTVVVRCVWRDGPATSGGTSLQGVGLLPWGAFWMKSDASGYNASMVLTGTATMLREESDGSTASAS